jgi:hypothetical protein
MNLAMILNLATTVAVVGGVGFGAWQLLVAARTRTTQISLHMLEMLNSPQLIDGLTTLHELPEGLGLVELRSRAGAQWGNVFRAISTFDGLGILVHRGEIGLGFADDFFHYSVAVVWSKTRGAIADIRTERNSDEPFQWLERLAERQSWHRANRKHSAPKKNS